MTSAFWYLVRIVRQCCHCAGRARLMAAKERIASVETSSSGSSAILGSSSFRKSRATSAAMLRGS